VNDAKPGDPCPDCGRPTETVTEENFFFKLSAFPGRSCSKLYESQPDFIQPETRRNEVISFVKGGLPIFPSRAPTSSGAFRWMAKRRTSSTSGSTR
jgi:methionyl-tRNA synthetase